MTEFLTSKIVGLIPALPIWYLSAKLYFANWPFLGAVVAFAGLSAWMYTTWILILKIEEPRMIAKEEAERAAAENG